MIMNSEEISILIDDFQDTSYTSVDFIVRNQETGEAEEIENFIPLNYFKRYLSRKYGSWLYLYPDIAIYRPYMALHSFINDWKYYAENSANQENWAKLWESYYYKYNPIENYDRTSEITTKYNGKETSTTDYAGSEKIETSFEGSESNTFTNPENGYTDTTESLRSPEDSANYTPVEKVENKIDHREESNTTTFNDRKNVNNREFDERQDKTEKSFENRNDVVTEHTHGNIGVSTVADMTMKTLEMVKTNLINKILDDFVNEHCIYWG